MKSQERKLYPLKQKDSPSRLLSWIYARNKTDDWNIPYRKDHIPIPRQTWLKMIGETTCPICHGDLRYIPPEVDAPVECLCTTLQAEYSEYTNILRMYATEYRRGKTLSEMKLHGTVEARAKLKDLIKSFEMWVEFPRGWAILYGNPGCGKSHILEALAHELWPIALYISADDFNQRIRKAVGVNMLEELIEAVKGMPVLLFDDWGTGKDSDFTDATLRTILQHRYNRPQEHPTIITTNMNKVSIQMQDPRIADRLFEVGKWVDLSSIPSYRRHK